MTLETGSPGTDPSAGAPATSGTEGSGGAGEPLVELRGVTRAWGPEGSRVEALQGVDLEIRSGDFIALMGPSGSGKTTLLNLLAGLDRPTAGTVRVAGVDLDRAREGDLDGWRNRTLGFIFQDFNLIPVLTVEENVELPLLPAGLGRGERRRRAQVALELVGLSDRSGHLPGQLSGGEKQRVAIARAVVGDPPLLLADEPTGNLDSASAARIMELLVLLNRELAKTIVLVTHDPEAAAYARRQIRLDKGVLAEAAA